jgi:hypothetical protein
VKALGVFQTPEGDLVPHLRVKLAYADEANCAVP